MNIFNYTINYNDLNINTEKIVKFIGYPDKDSAGPINKIIEESLEKTGEYCNIKGGIIIIDDVEFVPEKKIIKANRIDLTVKGIIYSQLKESEKIALFLCTAGPKIGDISKKLMAQNDYLPGYIFDVIGSIVVETAINNIQQQFARKMETSGFKITNRYSPGYCGWQTAEQHKLFSLLPNRFCGVTLTGSALMNPIKSVSGIIGIGENVTFNKYTCEICHAENCLCRNKR